MPNEDDQKRHINHIISAIRDDDADDETDADRSTQNPDELDYAAVGDSDAEYYANETERRQWDYEESNPATLNVDDAGIERATRASERAAGWGLLLDWRLMAALAILVAGLFMVNFSGDDDAGSLVVEGAPVANGAASAQNPQLSEGSQLGEGSPVTDSSATTGAPERIAGLEARIAELEQQLAALSAGGGTPVVGGISSGNTVTKDELQILRDQVNAGLKAQQETTRTAVRDLEQRLIQTIDTKVAAVSRPAATSTPSNTSQTQPQAQTSSGTQASSGPWFVNVATYSQRATAETMVERLREGGRSAAIVPATIGGEPSYRVRVVDLPSRDAAQRAVRELESQLSLRGLWIGES